MSVMGRRVGIDKRPAIASCRKAKRRGTRGSYLRKIVDGVWGGMFLEWIWKRARDVISIIIKLF